MFTDMNKTILGRYAQRAQAVKEWLDAKSMTGNLLMGKDGSVTRKEVLMVNGVIFFLIIGACAADGALWFTALCMICGGVLVHRLNKEDEKNHAFNWDSYDNEYDSYD